jgi:hypothetical protein
MTMGTWGDGQQAGEDSTLGRDRPVLQTRWVTETLTSS